MMERAGLLAAGAGCGGVAVAVCLHHASLRTGQRGSSVARASSRPDTKPYINVVKDGSTAAKADLTLTRAFDRVRNSDGSMDNVMTIHSLNPATMESHAALYTQCMKGDSPLSKVDREIVAVVASRCNRCTY